MSTAGIPGSRVIITGGASGMGEALVRALAREGAKVASLDRDVARGSAVAAAASAEAAHKVTFVACDIADKASVDASFGEAAGALGGLDTLIHAAGIAPGHAAEEIPVEEWDLVLSVNARGTFLSNQAAFRFLKDGGGRILNFASAAGVSGLAHKAHYSASKGAVIGWSRTVAKEWGHLGITVNMLVPAISTPMYAATRAAMSPDRLAALDARLAADMPIDGRLGDAERDFVPLMLFLCGDGARFMTGQLFAVDGGMTMVR